MLHVKVTQKHIDEGEPGIPQSCPIARAVKEQVNDASYVSVGFSCISVHDNNGNTVRFYMPAEARAFISCFDYDGEVKPFEFDAAEEPARGDWVLP